MPQVNPDGTVQVSPPLASAFGPASASAPPPPMQQAQQAPPGAQAQQSPGAAELIQSAIATLMQHLSPHSLTDAKVRTNQAINKQSE